MFYGLLTSNVTKEKKKVSSLIAAPSITKCVYVPEYKDVMQTVVKSIDRLNLIKFCEVHALYACPASSLLLLLTRKASQES